MTAMILEPVEFSKQERNDCRSCGTHLSRQKSRYCSSRCRKSLHWQLWITEGLLQALDCRFATFHWTDSTVILQVLPRKSERVFFYFANRARYNKPAADLKRLTLTLGDRWWNIKRNGKSVHAASRNLLLEADGQKAKEQFRLVRRSTLKPAGISANDINLLALSQSDLLDRDVRAMLKRAFRKRALESHPDLGGRKEDFIRVRKAFENLMQWAKNPALSKSERTSLPDGWVYDGLRKQWFPPSC